MAIEPYVPKYTFHVNLHERGMFYADVRNRNDRAIFTIKAGYGDDEDTVDSDTEFMNYGLASCVRGPVDLDKLRKHLIEIGAVTDKAVLVKA